VTAWLVFAGSAAVIVLAAVKLAEYGDAISVRTKMGGMFVGTLLLAGATSLPELLTTINALKVGALDLAAGNMFGSGMANMLLLAILDLSTTRVHILRRVGMRHVLTAALGIMLTGMAVFFILANISFKIGWIGVDSILIMGAYLVGVRLIQGNNPAPPSPTGGNLEEKGVPTLLKASIGFIAATGLLVLVTPSLVSSSISIAEQTGLQPGFVGAALLAITTSLPELVTVIAAVRFGAYDLAVGNLFGSNIFNMFALGFTDVLYIEGRFLGSIDPNFALVGLLVILMTTIGLISILARAERKSAFIEVYALLLIVVYIAGMWTLFARGVGI
jgi:cation:H+ antiporter